MLSCCHSFCTQCIQSLINESTRTNSITCPSCHQTTLVPKGGVTSLPQNLRLVNKRKDIFSKITSNPSPPCDSCNEDTSVVYCIECTDLFCNDCWNAHKKLRMSHTHVSLTLKGACCMSRDNLDKLIPHFSHTCQDHTDQQLDLYCQQCIIPICVKCTIINHKDHPVTEVSKQVDSNKATVHESIQGFQVAQQQLKKVLISGEEIKEKIKVCKNEIDTIIRQRFATLHQLLHEREEALLAQSSEVANDKEAHLTHQLEGIQHLLETMTCCESLVTSAVGEYNDVELLSVAHTLQTRAKQLQQEFSETSLEVCESPTISVDINTDELATKIANVDITFNEISPNNTTAVVPLSACIEKELNVKVVSRDSKGKKLSKGGAIVSGRLVPVEEIGTPIEAKTTDCGDGTYLISLTPQQLGEHKFSITTKGQSIQGSPINVSVVASRDYTTLNKPVQIITGIITPWFIAIADNSDIFATSFSTNNIYVLDNSGRQKAIIPCPNGPMGIAINGGIMYVTEYIGNKVSKFTLGGDFLGYFGTRGGHAQFSNPYGICIGPNNRIYVADYGSQYIAVFHEDETFSHIISSSELGIRTLRPIGLSFDLSGHLHVTDDSSNTVIVVTLEGQILRQYGQFVRPHGIAIDSTGNSLVVNYRGNSLSIFDPNGKYIHSIGELNRPVGVAVASNGSVWVAEKSSNRIVEY